MAYPRLRKLLPAGGCLAGLLFVVPCATPQMPPQPAKLVIRSDPANATITINKAKTSQRTNATFTVSPGTYTVTVGDAGSSTACAASTATVASGETAVWSCSGHQWTQAPKG